MFHSPDNAVARIFADTGDGHINRSFIANSNGAIGDYDRSNVRRKIHRSIISIIGCTNLKHDGTMYGNFRTEGGL